MGQRIFAYEKSMQFAAGFQLLVGLVPLQSFAVSGHWDVWACSGETITVTPLTGYRLTKSEVYMGEAEQVPATNNRKHRNLNPQHLTTVLPRQKSGLFVCLII